MRDFKQIMSRLLFEIFVLVTHDIFTLYVVLTCAFLLFHTLYIYVSNNDKNNNLQKRIIANTG